MPQLRWKAQRANVAAADFFEWPRLEQPLRSKGCAVLEGSAGRGHSFTSGAKVDVMNYDPAARLNEARHANQIQRRPRMLVICVDEYCFQFSGTRDLLDVASVFPSVDAGAVRQSWDNLRNRETNRLRLVG